MKFSLKGHTRKSIYITGNKSLAVLKPSIYLEVHIFYTLVEGQITQNNVVNGRPYNTDHYVRVLGVGVASPRPHIIIAVLNK